MRASTGPFRLWANFMMFAAERDPSLLSYPVLLLTYLLRYPVFRQISIRGRCLSNCCRLGCGSPWSVVRAGCHGGVRNGGAAPTRRWAIAGGATRTRGASGSERRRAAMSSPASLPEDIYHSAVRGELQKVVKWLRKGGGWMHLVVMARLLP